MSTYISHLVHLYILLVFSSVAWGQTSVPKDGQTKIDIQTTQSEKKPKATPLQLEETTLDSKQVNQTSKSKPKKTHTLFVSGELSSKTGKSIVEMKIPFRYKSKRYKTPTLVNLDPAQGPHIFAPLNHSCYDFEPFLVKANPNGKKEENEVKLPLVAKESILNLTFKKEWDFKPLNLPFVVKVNGRRVADYKGKPLTINQCTKTVSFEHPKFSKIVLRGPFNKTEYNRTLFVGKELYQKHKKYSTWRNLAWVGAGLSLVGLITVLSQAADVEKERNTALFQAVNPNNQFVDWQEETSVRGEDYQNSLNVSLLLTLGLSGLGYYYHTQIPSLEIEQKSEQ